MKTILLLATLALLLAGCVNDPAGATERTQIRNDADTAQVQAQADGQVGEAQAQAQARTAEAEAAARAEIEAARAQARAAEVAAEQDRLARQTEAEQEARARTNEAIAERDARTNEARARVAIHSVWGNVVVLSLFGVALVIMVVMYLRSRGNAQAPTQPRVQLDGQTWRALEAQAQARGQLLEMSGDELLLLDQSTRQIVARRQLTG